MLVIEILSVLEYMFVSVTPVKRMMHMSDIFCFSEPQPTHSL